MRIIGFNGPPRSGKDTLAKAIHDIHAMEYRFKPDKAEYRAGRDYPWMQPDHIESAALIMPCRIAAFALMGLGAYDDETYGRVKDEIVPGFGVTLRQFMIELMELHMKPKYGQDIAGKTLANELSKSVTVHLNEHLLLVTDIGFQAEVEVLSDLVGHENFLLVHLIRKNTSWLGDSRGWCKHDNHLIYNNDDTPESGAHIIMQHAHETLGWEF
jgi:hypothetical protein